ncbi:MAG: 30S ribosomal protein S4 [Candidatus Altiarchaeota archaeon]|nr:30S ribosomal protein S4 [Candidatus Altiarchaeota archaeon]
MGDPKRRRRRYSRPKHPWRAERITEEKEIQRKYGLKNKSEIWRARSSMARFRQQARSLLASTGENVEKEKKQLLDKLNKLGILESRSLDDVLALTVEDLLERRLQTFVYKKGLANTPKQARQLVVHGHVYIGAKKVNVPRYPVPQDEEDLIKIDEKIKVINVGEGRDKEKEAPKEAG